MSLAPLHRLSCKPKAFDLCNFKPKTTANNKNLSSFGFLFLFLFLVCIVCLLKR